MELLLGKRFRLAFLFSRPRTRKRRKNGAREILAGPDGLIWRIRTENPQANVTFA